MKWWYKLCFKPVSGRNQQCGTQKAIFCRFQRVQISEQAFRCSIMSPSLLQTESCVVWSFPSGFEAFSSHLMSLRRGLVTTRFTTFHNISQHFHNSALCRNSTKFYRGATRRRHGATACHFAMFVVSWMYSSGGLHGLSWCWNGSICEYSTTGWLHIATGVEKSFEMARNGPACRIWNPKDKETPRVITTDSETKRRSYQ